VGTGLTMLIQSSSAVMALTLVMCFNGWISFEMAASMVLGQNIGTTITANLAALVANTSAKRTAMAHLLFNLVGVILVLIVFKPFLHLVDLFIQKTGLTSPFPQEGQTAKQTAEAMPIALSIFHTVFNLLNTLILIWFVPTIVKAVTFLIKQRDTEEDFKLQFIHTGLLSTAELSLIQAKKEIHIYAHRIMKMFYYAKELVLTTSNKKYNKLFEKVKKCEEISDNLEIEIATYLTKITSEAVSSSGTEDINAMLSIISNLESIGDSFNTIANAVNRKKDAKISFTSELEKNLDTLLNIAEKMLTKMVKGIENNDGKTDHSEIDLLINKLKKTSLKLQTEHYKNLRKGIYKIKTGIIYSDICSELSKLCEYVHNISRIIIPHHEEKSELELTSS
jgi:phosphate:Na+ symporter